MKRYIKSYLITAGAMTFPLVAERLFFYPLVERSLVEEGYKQGFGLWTWFYGVLLMVGLAIGQGGNYVVLRHYSVLNTEERAALLRFARARFFCFAFPITSILSVILCATVDAKLVRELWPLLAAGLFGALYQSYAVTLTAVLRARQQLTEYFVFNVAPAVLLMLSCLLYMYLWPGQRNVSTFVLTVVIAMSLVGIFIYRRSDCNEQIHHKRVERDKGHNSAAENVNCLSRDANYASLISMGDHGVAYFPRMILGLEGLLRESGVFVAAVSLATLFLTPVVLLGASIMTVISGDKSNNMRGKRFWMYLIFVSICAIAVGAGTLVGLPIVAVYLYPSMTEDIKSISLPLSLSGLALVFVYLFRPHVMKWLQMTNVVKISLAIAGAVLILSLALVRNFSLAGAVWGYAIASVALAFVWAGFWFGLRSPDVR